MTAAWKGQGIRRGPRVNIRRDHIFWVSRQHQHASAALDLGVMRARDVAIQQAGVKHGSCDTAMLYSDQKGLYPQYEAEALTILLGWNLTSKSSAGCLQ